MKIWRMVPVLLICLTLASLTACNTLEDGGQEETSRQLIEVKRGDLVVSVSGSGNIVVSDEVRLAFGTTGRVEDILVNEGDEVAAGDALARIDVTPMELPRVATVQCIETSGHPEQDFHTDRLWVPGFEIGAGCEECLQKPQAVSPRTAGR